MSIAAPADSFGRAWRRAAARATMRRRRAAHRRFVPRPSFLLARRNVPLWSMFADQSDPALLTSKAQAVADFIREHGASFFDEISENVGMLPAEVEEALSELVAVGLVNSDSFAGLRVLLMPSGRRGGRANSYSGRHKRRLALFGMADAGRWALVRRTRAPSAERKDEAVEQIVRTLLRRWGVIFWKLLTREAAWLPPWREILSCCRRLEARGEIRGGRFVAGFSGEQFATPEAIGLLRDVRRKPPGDSICVALGGRSAQFDWDIDARAETGVAGRQSTVVQRRIAGGDTRRGRDSVTWRSCRRKNNGRRRWRCCAVTSRWFSTSWSCRQAGAVKLTGSAYGRRHPSNTAVHFAVAWRHPSRRPALRSTPRWPAAG